MSRLLLPILLSSLLLFCFSQDRLKYDSLSHRKAYVKARKLFDQAERLSDRAGDNEQLLRSADRLFNLALEQFNLLSTTAALAGDDSLAFFSRLKAAMISVYLDQPGPAKENWLAAINIKGRLAMVPDSFLFIPYLYLGGIYYEQNEFDSAMISYKKAASIQDQYAWPLNESERLYNRLGVMHYETGNYRQARNYFEKAIALTDPSRSNLIANYKINTASILIKLEEYQSAGNLYKTLMPSGLFPDEIHHNLGIISLKLQASEEAISYFRKVNYTASKKKIDLFYNFAMAYADLQITDSSELYYQKALAENLLWNGQRKNVQYGLLLKFRGDESVKKRSYGEALEHYQASIRQFDTHFDNKEISSNPENFSGVFSYINLFNTLVAKGEALEKLYEIEKNKNHLKSALDAYRAAFRLADYVEQSYDSDEARLFLNKIKHSAHNLPINLSLQLYQLTRERNYLEDAYFFDQRNKASVLSLNMRENENRPGRDNEIIRQEAALRSTLTRLTLKAAQLTDSSLIEQLNTEIRDAAIELGKIQEKIKKDPAYGDIYFTDRIPEVNKLQKKLDNKTIILSWHLSFDKSLVLLIAGNQFAYHETPIDRSFFSKLDSFKTNIQIIGGEQRHEGMVLSSTLYKILIAPISSHLREIDRLIIIPDDELNYLPFESLLDENRHFLVEKYSVQYQFSTSLLDRYDKDPNAGGILAFAPFASKGYSDSSGVDLSVLPSSREEVISLPGMILLDSVGTKENFMRAAYNYGIIHLATHASANNEIPNRSFIAFYPGPAEFKLYAAEIYNMHLDSTDLIILSACETGTGQLVKGEGLMSLSRAFAYAGCPNIITSLWKAEDKTTSYITQRLHHYLAKGFSKDKALQRSKIDLLENEAIDPRFKSPNYWAHLLLIGDYKPGTGVNPWWWIAGAILLGSVIYLLSRNKRFNNRKVVKTSGSV